MKIDSTNHTIVCEQWETPQVCNYLTHCIAPSERDGWKVTMTCNGQPEDEILYRNAKL